MRKLVALVIAVSVICIAAPATASASTYVEVPDSVAKLQLSPNAERARVPSSIINKSLKVGRKFWSAKHVRFCRGIDVDWRKNKHFIMQGLGGALAYAWYFGNPRCEIVYNTVHNWTVVATYIDATRAQLACATTVHEEGHLAGKRHTSSGIMRPAIEAVPVKCKKAFPWPDTDGDGLKDNVDDCPKKKGPKSNDGCPIPPDTDGDGLIDSEDECPTVSGPEDNNGCPYPDTDGDGIIDDEDACQFQVGNHTDGCFYEDTDGDGKIDPLDGCPDEPANTESGCPDEVAEPLGVTVGINTPEQVRGKVNRKWNRMLHNDINPNPCCLSFLLEYEVVRVGMRAGIVRWHKRHFDSDNNATERTGTSACYVRGEKVKCYIRSSEAV